MNQRYVEQWTEITKNMQKPFQAMLELNVKTLKKFKFFKAEDLAQIKTPEELWEKQVNLAIENGHQALEYFQQSFEIFEQLWGPMTGRSKQSGPFTKESAKPNKKLLNPGSLASASTAAMMNLVQPMLSGNSTTKLHGS
jgi:hypothetical protein